MPSSASKRGLRPAHSLPSDLQGWSFPLPRIHHPPCLLHGWDAASPSHQILPTTATASPRWQRREVCGDTGDSGQHIP